MDTQEGYQHYRQQLGDLVSVTGLTEEQVILVAIRRMWDHEHERIHGQIMKAGPGAGACPWCGWRAVQ